jgi:putative phosphoesterase
VTSTHSAVPSYTNSLSQVIGASRAPSPVHAKPFRILPPAGSIDYPFIMLIGILSDTHGRLDAARAAVDLLHAQNCQFLIHCGDVGSEEILDLLAGTPAAFVFGNNDWDRSELQRHANDIGVQCLGLHGELTLDTKRFAILHGDDSRLMRQLLDNQLHDYLLFGHTHIPADRRQGITRLINPGALHRASIKTVASLDTATDLLKFHTLPSP